tara:strand:- start:342 stop:539 length:198 start_codon:yes stop_codon:yes gene_type:complete
MFPYQIAIFPDKWLSQADGTVSKSEITVASKNFLQGLRYVEKDFEKENAVKENWAGRDELLKAMK